MKPRDSSSPALANRAVTAALCIVSGALYFWTLAPTVTSEDSGELIAAAYHFGVPHPPGYPLWTMLCGAFIRILHLGEVAWRANLFSALCSSLSTVPLFFAVLLLGNRRSAAFAAALVWAWSQALWSQSVITEVYGLNALLCSLMLWMFVKWHVSKNNTWLVAASLVWGLGMSNHHAIALLALPLGVWALLCKPRLVADWKLVLRCISASAAGLLPYVYLPIAASSDPPLNWGNPDTLDRFTAHVTRDAYGTIAPIKTSEGRTPARFARQMAYVSDRVARDMTWPLAIVALLGLLSMAWRKEPAAFMVLLCLLCCGVVFTLIANFDLTRTPRHAMKVFFIPLSLVLAIPLSSALEQFAKWASAALRGGAKMLVPCCLLAVPLLPAVMNYEHCNYRKYYFALDHARNILASMRSDALYFPSGDHTTFPVLYLTMVLNDAPDVIVANKTGRIDRQVIDALAEKVGNAPTDDSERGLEAWLLGHARRPAYFATKKASPAANISYVPVGLVYHLLPDGKPLDRESPWQRIRYRNLDDVPTTRDFFAEQILLDYHFFRALNHLRKRQVDDALADFSEAAHFGRGIKEASNNIGSALAEHGLLAEAVEYFQEARRLGKRYMTPRRNLVKALEQLEKWAPLEELLLEIAELDPKDHTVFAKLGDIALEVRADPATARMWWEKSLRINPNQPRLRQLLFDMRQ